MKDNKTKMFTGWKEVFLFTSGQTIKGKGFKATTVLIALLVAAVMAVICIMSGISNEEDNNDIYQTIDEITNEEGKYEFDTIDRVYLLNNTSYEDENIKKLFSITEKNFKSIDGIEMIESITADMAEDANAIVIETTEKDGGISIWILTTFNTAVSNEEADAFGEIVVKDAGLAPYNIGTFDEEDIIYLGMPTFSESVNAEQEEETLGMILARVLVPMLFCLFMYMIVLLHGQSISKAIVADKSSKLMEMLLTSVKPYAIISGKILGTATVAIAQMFIWIISGIIGFFIGDAIATEMNPDYVNQIVEIIKVMQNDSQGIAFSPVAIIIAVAGIIIGFFMYCVLAGLSGALVSKVEDMSSSQTIFQLPVIAAFLIAYFASMSAVDGGSGSLLLTVVRIVPLTSPFIMPADILIGNMTIIEALSSILVLVVSSLGLIIVTGKIYKGKIFNRH